MSARVIAALALSLLGCASDVDTLLGIEATIAASSVDVRAGTGGDVVSATVDVDYRVGTYTEMARDFQPQAIQVFMGDAPIAQITPQLPPDFTRMLAPGESASATLTGETTTATNPRGLCGGEARILFRWNDGTVSEIGMVETTTTDVTCD